MRRADVDTLIWLRRDLRLADNPALNAARAAGAAVLAVFVHAPADEGRWPAGAASRWYLHHSLRALQQDLAAIGVPLRCIVGPTVETLRALAREAGVGQVYWNRVVEPDAEALACRVAAALAAHGVRTRGFDDDCLLMPERVHKRDGTPYRVFTPFWRHVQERLEAGALEARLTPSPPRRGARGGASPEAVDALGLLSSNPWYRKLQAHWCPGEAAARRLLEDFLQRKVARYAVERDFPACDATSRLASALHFGEVSAARVYHDGCEALCHEGDPKARAGIGRFLAELGWREFARHVLHAFPRTPEESLNRRFDDAGVWAPGAGDARLRAWRRGETGVALVDAGMRQLWETGSMHNRVRMITASFLTKNLGIHWRAGARWFWDTLVDADLASNTLNWQWVAGCGTDAAPYYRIFNPRTQAERFDPNGEYVRRWSGGAAARVPMVDLKASRARALARYDAAIRGRSTTRGRGRRKTG